MTSILDPLNNPIIKDTHFYQNIIQNLPKVITEKENKTFKKGIIYVLHNTANNKIYIGQTIRSLNQRFNLHIHHARTHQKNLHLQRAVEKYGAEAFKIYPLHTISNQKQWVLDRLEIHYIALYDARNPKIGYNIHEGGLGGPRSPETKEKISQTLKNRVSPMKGRKQTQEHIEKRTAKLRNRPKSPETKAKISQSLSGKNHPYFGKNLSESHRENISSGRKNAHITLSKDVIDKQLETKSINFYRKCFSLQHLTNAQIKTKIVQLNNRLEQQIISGNSLKQMAEKFQKEEHVIRRMLHWKYNTRNLHEVLTQLNIQHSSRKNCQKKPISTQKIERDKFIEKIAQNSTYSEIMHSFNIQKKYQLSQLLKHFCGTTSLVKARSLILLKKLEKEKKEKRNKDNKKKKKN